MTEDIQARFEDIERRLAALEAAQREPAAQRPPGFVPDWLKPLDELFKSGNPARALGEADKLRAQAYAASSTAQLEDLHAYLSDAGRTVAYPRLGQILRTINRNLETTRSIETGELPPRLQRRNDLRPFPASQAAPPPAEESVAAPGDGAGDAGEN